MNTISSFNPGKGLITSFFVTTFFVMQLKKSYLFDISKMQNSQNASSHVIKSLQNTKVLNLDILSRFLSRFL